MNQVETLILGALLAFLGFSVIAVISIGNRLVRLEKSVTNAWSNVDVLLQRRHELIPNLVETAKTFANHERTMMLELIQLREEASRAITLKERERLESSIESGMRSFLLRCEEYPDLKSSAAFLRIQEELVNSEDRIAAARRFYNNNVREYNIALESFPSSLMRGNRVAREFFMS
jgi:LemA protein